MSMPLFDPEILYIMLKHAKGDISDLETKIDGLVSGFDYKGSVESVGDLPDSPEPSIGDQYTVEDEANAIYVWDGENWINVSKGAVNLMAGAFDNSVAYNPKDYCVYENNLYRFTAEHTGPWDAEDVEAVVLADDVTDFFNHLVEVTDTQPSSEWNRIWIQTDDDEYVIPTVEDIETDFNNVIAAEYSTSGTYAVGDYVMKDGSLYCCKTAISTAEAWTAAHWNLVKLANDVRELKSAITQLDDEVYQFIIKEKSSNYLGYTINANGRVVSDNSYNTYGYPVNSGDVLIINTDHTFGFYSDLNATGSTPSLIGTLYGSGDFVVTVPAEAKFLFVSTLVGGSYSVIERYEIGSTVKTAVGGGRYEIVQTASDVLNGNWTMNTTTLKLSYTDASNYVTTNLIDISMLKVGTKVSIISSISGSDGCFITDSSRTVLDYVNGYNAESKGYTSTSFPQLITFTVPQNAKYIVTDIRSAYYFNTDPSIFVVIGTKTDNITDMQEEIALLGADVLSGKKWVACGDSFTAGAFSNSLTDDYIFTSGLYAGEYKVYPFWIGRRNQNLTVINEAISGSTMGGGENGVNPFSGTRYQAIPADTDFITLEFGINDSGNGVPIGTIDDVTNETFYGAWNVVLSWLLENRPFAHIGIIVGPGLQTNSGKEYAEAEIAIAKKWGIPYLNVQFESGGENIPLMLRTSNPDVSETAKSLCNSKQYVNPSAETPNHHPNEKAHEFESNFIEAFLRRI